MNKFLPYILALVFVSVYVLACSPSEGDAWYISKLTIDQSTLPQGVELYYPCKDCIAIKNNGNEPLYFGRFIPGKVTYEESGYWIVNGTKIPTYRIRIGEFSNDKDDWEHKYNSSGLPLNFVPKYKLVNGKQYYYHDSETNWANGTKEGPGWKPNYGGLNNHASSSVMLNEISPTKYLYYDNGQLIDLNGYESFDLSELPLLQDKFLIDNILGDDKPSNVSILKSKKFNVTTYYKGKLVNISLAIDYTLNDKYDPHLRAKGIKACNDWSSGNSNKRSHFLVFSVIIVLLLAIGAVTIIYIRRKNRL